MKKSTKALLASIFIFPGFGQLILKKYITATGLISFTFIAVIYIFKYIYILIQEVISQLRIENAPPNFFEVLQIVQEKIIILNTAGINISIGIIALTWIVSVLDIYRLKKENCCNQLNII